MNSLLAVRSAQVAVPLPVKDPFTYSIPEEFSERAVPGVRVRVPFKNRDLIGYIVSCDSLPPGRELKPILEVLDEKPVIHQSLLNLTEWMARYYGSSWGEAIENALPKWVKHGKKRERALAKKKSESDSAPNPRAALTLSNDQEKALAQIRKALEKPENAKPFLLFGVTGSGKSELYIRTIYEVMAQNRSAICLVPEIALTEQLKNFFHHHFGDRLEILHSKMNDTERFLAWHRLETGERHIVLGPRSAVFAPLQNLGLIIIDEEHEGSYKQETTPRYHAREVALERCRSEKALLILGSATPSLESMYRAESGIFERLNLTSRIENKPLPQVHIVDLKRTAGPSKKPPILSTRLVQEIDLNLKKKEGTMLLLNRRGFSTHITCPRCGTVESCSSCQVSLTFHQEDGVLRCHYCNYQKTASAECAECQAPLLRFSGFGTEKVESEVAKLFPQARLVRLDADTVKKKGSHEIILKEFRDQKADILIGTQMIAKGFDFPHVTLVGVILADVGLMLPDFRSAERTFQLLTQVAGRAGRGSKLGRVIVQTFSPDHPSIRFAKDHDFDSFYRHETQERYQYRYPPYSQLANLIIRSRKEDAAYRYALEIRNRMKTVLLDPNTGVKDLEIIGPAPLPFYRLRGHFRWHIMIKHDGQVPIAPEIETILAGIKRSSQVATALDMDPLNIL